MPFRKKDRPVPALISLAQARRSVLFAQGVLGKPRFGEGKAGALAAVEHLGYVQIDTISVVERAHHHTLWSRVPGYSPAQLQELQTQDRAIFEYWSHAAAYLPLRDYRFALRRMEAFANGKRHWFRRDNKVRRYVLDRIRAEGPLRARDFEAPAGHRGGSWFEWKPAKSALEQLFWCGELMVRERRRFEKVFDLRERVLPDSTDVKMPSKEEFFRHLIGTALRSQGLATAREISYQRHIPGAGLLKVLGEMREAREVLEFKVEGGPGETYYWLNDVCVVTDKGTMGDVRILSPFDNLVIQRKRLSRLFSYDYQIECYVPEPKRKFGYFCLPLLRGADFLGRLDAKADRAAGVLRIENFHWERSVHKRSSHLAAVQAAIEKFSHFNACTSILGMEKLTQ